jgi:hypothetical protein
MSDSQILLKAALEIAETFEHGPKTLSGIRNAGESFGFVDKYDGFHYSVDKDKFLKYLQVVNNTPFAVSKKIGVNAGSLTYQLARLGISLKSFGSKKYLEDVDVRKITEFYYEKNKLKNKK